MPPPAQDHLKILIAPQVQQLIARGPPQQRPRMPPVAAAAKRKPQSKWIDPNIEAPNLRLSPQEFQRIEEEGKLEMYQR